MDTEGSVHFEVLKSLKSKDWYKSEAARMWASF